MSKFVFTTLGSLGDLHPYIAVARILRQRGHEAVIATCEEYREIVDGEGLGFVSVRPGFAEMGDYQTLVGQVLHSRRGPSFLIKRLVMPYLRLSYDALWSVSEDADLLVSHPLTVTMPLVAEKRGLPWLATVLAPMSIMSCDDPPTIATAEWFRSIRKLGAAPYRFLFGLAKWQAYGWEKPLREFRRELGLPPQNQFALFEGQFSPIRNLALFDAQLAPPQADWPAHTRVCGSPIYDGGPPDPAIVAELEKFLEEGEPPIVFALGSSAVWIAGNFWDFAVAAARRLNRRAILITGPQVPDKLPDGIKAFSYLPYSIVFRHAAVVVHTAGIGTLSRAMRSGRPQLIVPVAFDQPDNARRTQALGVGRILPFRKVTSDRLFAALDDLLANGHYAQCAADLARALDTDGAGRAADELVSCLSRTNALALGR